MARRAGGREPRLCPKPSCLREALSPTACGRSPLPEGAKEFFDNLGFPLGGKAKKLKNVRFLVKTPLPNFLHNDIILKR